MYSDIKIPNNNRWCENIVGLEQILLNTFFCFVRISENLSRTNAFELNYVYGLSISYDILSFALKNNKKDEWNFFYVWAVLSDILRHFLQLNGNCTCFCEIEFENQITMIQQNGILSRRELSESNTKADIRHLHCFKGNLL